MSTFVCDVQPLIPAVTREFFSNTSRDQDDAKTLAQALDTLLGSLAVTQHIPTDLLAQLHACRIVPLCSHEPTTPYPSVCDPAPASSSSAISQVSTETPSQIFRPTLPQVHHSSSDQPVAATLSECPVFMLPQRQTALVPSELALPVLPPAPTPVPFQFVSPQLVSQAQIQASPSTSFTPLANDPAVNPLPSDFQSSQPAVAVSFRAAFSLFFFFLHQV
jgi:hypothetical protein